MSVIYIYNYRHQVPRKFKDVIQEQWRAAHGMAKKWQDVINKHGRDITLVLLPEIGIKGNTHFPMSDLNNVAIADLMYNRLKEKRLDK
ncbi:MAG TPA: hypothetical protein VLZ54_01210 [Arenibacter sp.]|nr:hypothetical protein [Arenibacter sp.]